MVEEKKNGLSLFDEAPEEVTRFLIEAVEEIVEAREHRKQEQEGERQADWQATCLLYLFMAMAITNCFFNVLFGIFLFQLGHH